MLLAVGRGLLRFDEIRPGCSRWKRKRDFVFRGLEDQLTLEHGRVEVIARHSMNGLFAGIRDIIAGRISNAESQRYGLKVSTFPWIKFVSPDELKEQQLKEQVERVEAFNKALKLDPAVSAAIEASSGGMLERHKKHVDEQRAQLRAESAGQEALARVQGVLKERADEIEARRRRLARQS